MRIRRRQDAAERPDEPCFRDGGETCDHARGSHRLRSDGTRGRCLHPGCRCREFVVKISLRPVH